MPYGPVIRSLPHLEGLVAEQPAAEFGWNSRITRPEELKKPGAGYSEAGMVYHDGSLIELVRWWAERDAPGLAWTHPTLWQFARLACDVAADGLGGAWRVLPAVSAWRTRTGERGWPLHRDHAGFMFDPDGSPIALTFWCTVLGGGEGTGGVRGVVHSTRLSTGDLTPHNEWWSTHGAPPVDAEQNVYRGNVYCWNHATLHEGTMVQEGERVAFAVELVREDYAGDAALDPANDVIDQVGLALWSWARYAHMNKAPSMARLLADAHCREHRWAPEFGGAFDEAGARLAAMEGNANADRGDKVDGRRARMLNKLRQQVRGFSPVLAG